MSTRVLACLLAAACVLVTAMPVRAQVLERSAQVEVPIVDDNLDAARQQAVRRAQRQVVAQAISEVVHEQWVTHFQDTLNERILGRADRLDRYIRSYRLQRAEPSVDRTRYFVTLVGRLDQTSLREDLREIPLPLLDAPPRTVRLFYRAEDPVLESSGSREVVISRIRERLSLLNLRVEGVSTLRGRAAEVLADPQAASSRARAEVLERYGSADGVFLGFAPGPDGVGLVLELHLYQRATGQRLVSLQRRSDVPMLTPPLQGQEAQDSLLERLVRPLAGDLHPGVVPLQRLAGGGARLQLRVLGFRSVKDEDAFEAAFFSDNPRFQSFALAALGADAVTYEGSYTGDVARLPETLEGTEVGPFRVRNVFWYDQVLEMEVHRVAEAEAPRLRTFPPETRPADVQSTLSDYLERYPNLAVEDPLYTEQEDNGWLDRANPAALNATIYGFVDSRSDSDVYVAEALEAGTEITLIWNRVGRTTLAPAVRIYDADGRLVETFHPRSWLRTVHTVPEGQHRLYVEVGDRFGELEIDTGGYRSFHYLFKLQTEEGFMQVEAEGDET